MAKLTKEEKELEQLRRQHPELDEASLRYEAEMENKMRACQKRSGTPFGAEGERFRKPFGKNVHPSGEQPIFHGKKAETHLKDLARVSAEVRGMENNKPAKKFRIGAVCATIWSNQGVGKDGKARAFASVNVEKGYKDKEGVWKSGHSFSDNDLPKAIMVLTKAYEFLALRGEAEEASFSN